jgi:hypothetical protein
MSKKYNNVAMNTARIMHEYPVKPETELDSLELCEAVVKAAESLDELENSAPDFWEGQPNDWESACASIAYMISRDGEAPNKSMIKEAAIDN